MGIYNDLIDFKQIFTSLSLFRMAADQWLISCAKIAAETSLERHVIQDLAVCKEPISGWFPAKRFGFSSFDPCYHDRKLYSIFVVCVYIILLLLIIIIVTIIIIIIIVMNHHYYY
jgi:hypothetical protein